MDNGLHFTDTDYVQKISNHPVHIVDKLGNISPSAFIPFCQFGGNMSAMGQKYKKFDDPVCNSFKDKTLRGQVCYEVDPNKYIKSIDQTEKSEALRKGLIFLMDYNEDRQNILNSWEYSNNTSRKKPSDMFKSFSKQLSEEKSDIHVQTISINTMTNYFIFS